MKSIVMKPMLAILALCLLADSANAVLSSRLSGQAYYDSVLNITWLANANLAGSNTFGVSGIGSTPADLGYMNWNTANSWIAAMNGASYLGVSAWRLPKMIDIDNDGCLNDLAFVGTDCGYNVVSVGPNASEMASLYYQTLGNLAFFNTSGQPVGPFGIQFKGPFSNLGNFLYWYGLETTSAPPVTLPTPDNAWYFGMPSGGQRPIEKTITDKQRAWAVVDGDVGAAAAVPVPAAVWLFGSAVGLMGVMRRKVTKSS